MHSEVLVVRLLREERRSVRLSVRNGGNDGSLIHEAHIGMRIFKKERVQAASSADYAVGEFKHLLRLTPLLGR